MFANVPKWRSEPPRVPDYIRPEHYTSIVENSNAYENDLSTVSIQFKTVTRCDAARLVTDTDSSPDSD